MPSPRITAIICTHNNASRLRGAIESLLAQSLSAEAFEVAIVDNGSSDETASLLREYTHRRNLFVIREEALGLSNARNTGWIRARTDLVAYLDDDAQASPNWLENIARRFDESESAVGVVGGPVLPRWEAAPPPWLRKEHYGLLSLVDLGTSMRQLDESEWLAGTNIAYRRSTIRGCGGFHPGLGRSGTLLSTHEETFLNARIREVGQKLIYDPEIVVQHWVPTERMTLEYLTRVSYWIGKSGARADLLRMTGSDECLRRIEDRSILDAEEILKMVLEENTPVTSKVRLAEWHGYASELFCERRSFRPIHLAMRNSQRLEGEIGRMHKEYGSLSKSVVHLREKNEDLERTRDLLNREIGRLNSLSKAVDHLREKNEDLERTRDLLNREIGRLKEDNCRITTEFGVLRREYDDIRRDYESVRSSYSYLLGMRMTWPVRRVWNKIGNLRGSG